MTKAQITPMYPEPEGPPGHPFKDPNFKLVILEDLLDQGLIELGTPEQLAAHLLKREVDLQAEGYELMPQCLEYLYRYPLGSDLLSQVRGVIIDGGLKIYTYAFYFWSGESEDFDIGSFDGIEHCRNIETYWESSMCTVRDLSQLAPLEKLASVSLSHRPRNDQYKNLAGLLALPSLKTLSICRSTVDQLEAGEVVATFERKGGTVTISPC